ncbi:MAG: hypothetical protein NVS3B21_19030 [Acidimicrobiales bacterium]
MRRLRHRIGCAGAATALAALSVALPVGPAGALNGPDIEYSVDRTLSLTESAVGAPDPAQHTVFLPDAQLCDAGPECRIRVVDIVYPANADPDVTYITTVTATIQGSGNYELEIFKDPQTNSVVVAGDTSGQRELHANIVTGKDDPIQEFGVAMFLAGGTPSPYRLNFTSVIRTTPTPFESLNPVGSPSVTPGTPDTPPASPGNPADGGAPKPRGAATNPGGLPTGPVRDSQPGPPDVLPIRNDPAFSGSFGTGTDFQSALSPAKVDLFKKAAAIKPPGNPDPLQLALALLAFPAALMILFVVLVRRRRLQDSLI